MDRLRLTMQNAGCKVHQGYRILKSLSLLREVKKLGGIQFSMNKRD